ncbi:threonine--tRNA ligase [Patescibacteria group bacterium]|nr:threonine--tRNA ligase [Patescibacteria group bacterium]
MKKIEKIENIRHSLAHVLASAVKELYPKVELGMGPAIENGFYYDFALPIEASGEGGINLKEIEKKMKELIKKDFKFERESITKEAAKKLFKGEKYKLELIKDLKEKKVIVYKSGDFVDLCKGPHIKSSKEIPFDSFELERIAGAYWKGNEKNKMLTRIYGIAFENKKELSSFIEIRKEAEKRDHRKLGKLLDLFTFSELVGSGLPLFTPKGTIIIEELKKEIEKICRGYGFEKVITPHLAKIALYEASGHAKKFSEELFHVTSEQTNEFVLKPVQCPHQTQIYASRPRSYKDLPIRYMESEKQFRAEKAGEVGGLNRVYAMTIEDGHTFCTIDQVKQEIKNMVEIIEKFYKSIGLWDNHWVSLSVRDPKTPEKYIGDIKDWNLCEKILKEVSDEMKLGAKKIEGEAALYGPKLDFMFKDALGKEIQIPTVQIDFATPKRFDLAYTDKDGKEKPPVMVHRAILGTYERFLALILEHFAGALPVWLSPVQIYVIPIGEKHIKYAQDIFNKLNLLNLRVELRDENETLSKKIRHGETQKIPYLLIAGDNEKKNKTVSVRKRSKGNVGELAVDKFSKMVQNEISKKI